MHSYSNGFFNFCRPLFGDDDNVADTLGINFKASKKEDSAKKADTKKTASDSDDVSFTKKHRGSFTKALI